jgi:peptide/nickel transport system substrate-binding protein
MEAAEVGFKYVAEPQVPGVYWDFRWTGPAPTTFQENPKFATLVAQGKLPRLEERLPEEVKVIKPVGEIGVYGGLYRNTATWWMFPTNRNSKWIQKNGDEISVLPHVGFWEISDDGRVHTFRLRKGLKWGDGDPMDMEDIRFAWEDINFNTKINENLPSKWFDPVTGSPVKFAVVDDTHWTLTFDTPNFTLLDSVVIGADGHENCTSWCFWSASHYLKQYHEDYASAAEIQAAMEEAGAATWLQLWGWAGDKTKRLRMPNTTPFILASTSDTLNTWDANPYYHVVDPEGNQLPYVDGAMVNITASREVGVFRAMAGETDGNSNGFEIPEIPLYRSNMDKGDYNIKIWPALGGTDYGTSIGQTYNTDPEIGKWNRTSDFRQAMSLALDREAIIDSVLLGLGTAKNFVVHPSLPYYPGDEWAFHNSKYDPAAANALLDGLGLTARDSDGFRLRSDGSGERLSFTHLSQLGPTADVMELEQDYYADVGIELKNRPMQNPNPLQYSGKEYMLMYGGFGLYTSSPWLYITMVPMGGGPSWAPDIGDLDRSMKVGPAGATITEGGYTPRCGCPVSDIWLPQAPANTYPADPTGTILRIREAWLEGRQYSMFSPERIELGKEINRIHGEQKFYVAVASHTGAFRGVYINRNNLVNVPDTHAPAVVGFYTEQYYFIDGKDNVSD